MCCFLKCPRALEDVEEGETVDKRKWTQCHMDATGPHPTPCSSALTPPQGEAYIAPAEDVDVRGPMGIIPLMVASYFSNGVDEVGLRDSVSQQRSNGSDQCSSSNASS